MSGERVVEHEVRCVVDCAAAIGEGVFWSAEEQAVFWLDVPRPSRIHRFTPATGEHQFWNMPEMVTAMARRPDGTLLVASENGLNRFDPATGEFSRLTELEPHLPDNRTNDGAPDARGRFWIGTMQNNLGENGEAIPIRGASGSLWRVEPDLSRTPALDGFSITNGVAWSPDNTRLYVVDSMLDRIYRCSFDLDTGAVGTPEIFSDITGLGTPDGNAVDAEGFVWSARWDGHAVVRFSPAGEVDRVVPIPASLVTSCAFGGSDLATLFVTTALLGVEAGMLRRYPLQGGLFALNPGVRGLPRPLFGG